MHVSISGAQGTGKSTLLCWLQDDPELSQNFTFKGNTTRAIREQGVEINELGSDKSQLLIASKHLEHYTNGNVILDRCALDGLVYTAYLYEKGQVSKRTLRIAESVFENLRYEIMFYIAPEFEIENDNVRSVDKDFRDRIVELFEEYMEAYSIVPIRLTGTLQERATQVKDAIRAYQVYIEETRKAIIGDVE